jgi:acyl-CoA thioester hydrolase
VAPFTHSLRVRYAECDAQGVVFNSHYLAFVDIGITELWRAAFGSYQAMLDRDVDVVVAEAHLRFRRPARFDDELRCEVMVTHLGSTSIVTRHLINRQTSARDPAAGSDGEQPLVEVEIRHVMVDRESLRKAPIPDWVRTGLEPWLEPSQPSG